MRRRKVSGREAVEGKGTEVLEAGADDAVEETCSRRGAESSAASWRWMGRGRGQRDRNR